MRENSIAVAAAAVAVAGQVRRWRLGCLMGWRRKHRPAHW